MPKSKITNGSIENNKPTNYYLGIYGKGEDAKMYFAFKLIPICLALMFIAIILVFLTDFLFIKFLGISFNPLSVLGIVVPIFSMPLSFMLGYLYGKPADK